jgi:branched-chain amino acid aminotransferase
LYQEEEMEAKDKAYFEGKIIPLVDARVNIMTHAFNYGTAVFEGIRGYYNQKDEQLYILRLHEHLTRFLNNCKILYINLDHTEDALAQLVVDLAVANHYTCDVYIRPLAYKSACRVGVKLDEEDALAIYMVPFGDYVDTKQGLNVMVSSWRRIRDNAIPARGKICGCYVNSALAATEARKYGFDEAIFLTDEGMVSEGSVMNLFILRKGKLHTPPVTADILEGVTRTDVMVLASEELGLETVERDIHRSELYRADEIFFCGTGAKIVPIVSVDKRRIGKGTPGEITRSLQTLYEELARGISPKYSSWRIPVYR